MELGIGTYTYGWAFDTNGSFKKAHFNEFDLIERARSFSVSLIQVGDNLPLHSFSEDRLESFKNAVRDNSLTVEIGARGMTAAHLQHYILICREMGARLLRFVIDAEGYHPSAVEVECLLQAQLPMLQDHNIVLAIENHDRFRAKELARILDAVNSQHVGICLDTVNSLGAGEGIEMVIDVLSGYTVNLHLKDFGINRLVHKQGFRIEGRIAGEGMLGIPVLLKKISAFKRCHTCVLEQWVPPEKSIAETIAKEAAWAQKSIEYLKSIWKAGPGKGNEEIGEGSIGTQITL